MILEGKTLADSIQNNLAEKLKEREVPKLVIFLIGENSASKIYVKAKKKACKKIGIDCEILSFDANVSQDEVQQEIQKLNEDSSVHAILIQSPVPNDLSFKDLVDTIDPKKDVDGLGSDNVSKLYYGDDTGIIPGTPKGILKLLEHHNIPVHGKNVVVIGKSVIVGKPVSMLFLQAGATVTICHSKTLDLSGHTSKADIIVSAVGKQDLVSADMISEDANVIDVGINRLGENTITGDCDFEKIEKKAAISPVPGGVGPMTIACLLENVLHCQDLQKNS